MIDTATMYTCTYIHTCVLTYLYICIHVLVHMYPRTCMCMYVRMCIHVLVYVHLCSCDDKEVSPRQGSLHNGIIELQMFPGLVGEVEHISCAVPVDGDLEVSPFKLPAWTPNDAMPSEA